MKGRRYIELLWILVLTSCDLGKYEPPIATQPSTPPTTTVAEVIARYLPKTNDPTPINYEISASGGKEIVISGVVTSSDAEANGNGYIVVQEPSTYMDNVPRAIRINIRASEPLFLFFPPGQQVSVRLNGLYITRIARCPQITEISFVTALSAIQRHGIPDTKLLNSMAGRLLLEELSFPRDIWRWVVFPQAIIVKNESEPDTFTRPSRPGDPPTSHLLVDKFSYPKGYAFVSFAGCHFGNTPLPVGQVSIRAIVSWHDDTPTTTLDYQPRLVNNSAQEFPAGLRNYRGPRLSIRVFNDVSPIP